MGFLRKGFASGGELFGGDTGRTRTRTDKAESQQDIHYAYTADSAAEGRMKHHVNERRKMAKEKIVFPEGGPREIEEQGSHFEANDDQQCT
jgi:hypothetical protein